MPWRRRDGVRLQCYPTENSLALRIAGGILIASGILLILLCVPTWAWVSIVGAALILLGLFLIRK